MILGQYNLVLFGIKWYWVKIGLLCLYILKKIVVTSTDQPTNQHAEYRAICFFRKLENRKKAEICNSINGDYFFQSLFNYKICKTTACTTTFKLRPSAHFIAIENWELQMRISQRSWWSWSWRWCWCYWHRHQMVIMLLMMMMMIRIDWRGLIDNISIQSTEVSRESLL